MRSSAITVSAALLALAFSGLACTADVVLPDPPREQQVEMVAAIYDNPTGTIDVAAIQTKLDDIQARITELHLDWLPPLIAQALEALSKRLTDASLTPDTEDGAETSKRTVIDAAAYMKRICRGWSDTASAPDEAANGSMQLTAVIEASSLRQDIWGEAMACKTRLDPLDVVGGLTITPSPSVNLFIDGTLDVRLYGPLPRTVGDALPSRWAARVFWRLRAGCFLMLC